MSEKINIRLAVLKEKLDCNWSQLADKIGVSRQMLGDVRRGKYNLGHDNAARLEQLELSVAAPSYNTSLAHQASPSLPAAAEEEPLRYLATTCPTCRAYQSEIAYLREQLTRAQEIALLAIQKKQPEIKP